MSEVKIKIGKNLTNPAVVRRLVACPFCECEILSGVYEDKWTQVCPDCRKKFEAIDEALSARASAWTPATTLPKEYSYYLVQLASGEFDVAEFNENGWRYYTSEIIAWRKIEPYQETTTG